MTRSTAPRLILFASLLLLGAMLWNFVRTGATPKADASTPRPEADAAPANAAADGAAARAALPPSRSVSTANQPDPEETPSTPPPARELDFVIEGVMHDSCSGVVTIVPKQGDRSTFEISTPRFTVPLEPALSRVDLAVDGYYGASYTGPFDPDASPVRIRLGTSGSIAVQLVDSRGSVLANRLIYAFLTTPGPHGETGLNYPTTRWGTTDARDEPRSKGSSLAPTG